METGRTILPGGQGSRGEQRPTDEKESEEVPTPGIIEIYDN